LPESGKKIVTSWMHLSIRELFKIVFEDIIFDNENTETDDDMMMTMMMIVLQP
jgi:hypothetical protein